MADDFRVTGANDFLKLSKALKVAGRTEMRKELNKGMRDAAKPLAKEAKQAALETFPARGGLAKRESKIPFRPQTRTGATPGVRIVAPGKYVVGKTVNASGRFRHPVHADPDKTRREWRWVNQQVPGGQGWFDRRMEAGAPAIRKELEKAMEAVAQKIIEGAK